MIHIGPNKKVGTRFPYPTGIKANMLEKGKSVITTNSSKQQDQGNDKFGMDNLEEY